MSAETLAWILAAGLATGLGGLGLLLLPRPSDLLLDGLLGFTAGVMLAATSFSLLVPALDEGTVTEVVGGVAAGGATLLALDALVPHEERPPRASRPRRLSSRRARAVGAQPG